MIVEVWQSKDTEGDVSFSVIPSTHTPEQRENILGDGAHIKLREIEAPTWTACMTKHHELMGWEPYKPMEGEP
jgi:hypothetical protein